MFMKLTPSLYSQAAMCSDFKMCPPSLKDDIFI